ncbi:mRNA decay activator protein ZFP36-like [Rhinatrema bivittatum]|uniref:mRNA decay activator protein ZFP36-like n=1 Tax=Rhinatrema bivittatum TaxID=194408 RepID=UPI00112792EC|nr:mRNA decay activator protein ZFP36-like [Rhinatrema bivittatum]
MPSDLLSPFLELDLDLCENFLSLRVLGEPGSEGKSAGSPRGPLQRTHSAHPASTEQLGSSGSSISFWPVQSPWSRAAELPCSSLLHRIPFQVDRSVSMIEGPSAGTGSHYKTELFQSFRESSACSSTARCRFVHGLQELHNADRQLKCQAVPCHAFHTSGYCLYGALCHFLHQAGEQEPEAPLRSRSPSFAELISLYPPETLCHSCMEPPSCCSPETPQNGCSQPISSSLSSQSPPLPSSVCSEGGFSCSKTSLGTQGLFTGARRGTEFGSFLGGMQAKAALKDPAGCSTLPPGLRWHRSHSWDSLSDQDSYSSGGSESPGPGVGGLWLPIFSRISLE